MPITPAPSATELCAGGSGGGGGGTGTVTSITDRWTAVPEILVNGADFDTITTSGTFAHTWVDQGPYEVLASPANGSVGTPLFRGLVIDDIPDLSGLYWALLGNAGTVAGTNYLGTNDNQDLVFKTNLVESTRIKTPVGGRAGYVGVGTNNPSSQLEVYKNNSYAASSAADVWAFFGNSIFTKWQPSSVPYKGHQFYTGWYADPAGYTPAPAGNYGSGVDYAFDICTQGDPSGPYPTPAAAYLEYAGIAINMNFTAKPGGDATNTSDGQSGGYVYDGHLNKPWYVVVPSSGALKQQIAGNVKLMELGMHNAVPPYRSGAPYTVADGLQMNLSDKPVSGQPFSGVYDYVRCVPGSPTVTGVGTLPPDRSTVFLNGVPYVALSSVGTTVTLTTNYSGGMTSVSGAESVHYVYEVGSIVTATNGSTAVARSSGLSFDTAWKGYQILLGGTIYYIASVTDANNLVLTGAFGGTTGTTNANFYSIYVAQQDNALHFQTHSDARNWNTILQHNHGFATPCNDQGNVRTMISGDGGLFNRFGYIAPYKTAWSPGANWGTNTPLNIGSALYITEEFTAEMTGALVTMLSPVKAARQFLYARQDTSTYASNAIQLDMSWGAGTGAPDGLFTGNFIACYKDDHAAPGGGLKFWVEAQGNVRGRFLDIGPRADGYVASPANIVSVSDANYLAGTGNNFVDYTARTGAHAVHYMRQDVGTFSGNFLAIAANTSDAGGGSQGSGVFAGNYLLFSDFTGAAVSNKLSFSYDAVLFIGDNVAPPGVPVAGGYFYVTAGALFWRGSAGTITPLAVA